MLGEVLQGLDKTFFLIIKKINKIKPFFFLETWLDKT